MTEYDFSPEAYERYMHTQHRIANWVDQTEEHRPQFGSATAPSSQQGTPLMHSRPHHQRHQSAFERRRPSFSSSSSSSSSSTNSSDRSRGTPGPMPAFQPMYLQHPVADPFHSNRPHNHGHSSHGRSPPPSLSYVTAAPPVYGYNSGHSSSGVPTVLPQLKGMSLVTSPLSPPHYQPMPAGVAGKPGYPFPQATYPQNVPAGGTLPSQSQFQPRSQTQPLQQYPLPQGAYPPPTIYPLTVIGPQQSTVQPPVFYQRVYTRRKGSRRSGSERRSR